MRTAIYALAISLASMALASADPAPAPAASAKPAACKKVVVGRGLERHVTCEIDTPIVLSTPAPKPSVAIVHVDGKRVTGRPQSPDRFSGLSHQLR